jgi:hypothetical protein
VLLLDFGKIKVKCCKCAPMGAGWQSGSRGVCLVNFCGSYGYLKPLAETDLGLRICGGGMFSWSFRRGYRDFGVLSGNGWLGTVELNIRWCCLVMLIVQPRDALSLLLGRRNSLTFINTPNIYKRRLISRWFRLFFWVPSRPKVVTSSSKLPLAYLDRVVPS